MKLKTFERLRKAIIAAAKEDSCCWDLLTGQRGPDSESEGLQAKGAYTVALRRFVGLNVGKAPSFVRLFVAATNDAALARCGDHFEIHILSGLEAGAILQLQARISQLPCGHSSENAALSASPNTKGKQAAVWECVKCGDEWADSTVRRNGKKRAKK